MGLPTPQEVPLLHPCSNPDQEPPPRPTTGSREAKTLPTGVHPYRGFKGATLDEVGMFSRSELSEAEKLWDGVLEKGHKPNAFTCSLLISGFCEDGNVK
ncbi:Pentatricopeptide repeat-containing protein At5g16420, mitochondrial [Linum perenne]